MSHEAGENRETELGVPEAVLLAWNLAPAPTKGPKPRWTLQQLLDTAVGLGDQGGIEAISMSGLAKALGSGTMSLYRYVSSREVLVVLAADHALGPPPAPVGTNWRERLHAWVLDLRRVYLAHPWLTAVPVGTEPLLPSYLRRLEAGLDCVADLGLSGTRAVTVLTLLWTYTRADAEQGAQLAAAESGHPPEEVNKLFADRLRVLGKGEEFGLLLGVLDGERRDSSGEGEGEQDAEFLDAIDIILTGIETKAVS
ncbi:TetR/AcrR family transcriptional regulator [Saccharomonospora sp. NPDC006951]